MAIRCLRLLLPLCLMVGNCAASSNVWSNTTSSLRYTQDDLDSRLEQHLERRFYAIRPIAGVRQEPDMIGAGSHRWTYYWQDVRRTRRNSLPPCGDYALVQYCYVDEASRDTLNLLNIAALEKWAPVLQSAENELTVSLVRSHHLYFDVCNGRRIPPWVVRISDCTEQDCKFSASLGMRATDNFIKVNTKVYDKFFEDGDPRKTAAIVLELARKWGNIFGLKAEQLRPDASNYVDFRCLFLQPTEDTHAIVNAIRADSKDKTRELSSRFPAVEGDNEERWLAQRIRFVCSGQNPFVTGLYFPEVFHYLPDPSSRLMVEPGQFDFDSIMIAPSYLGSMDREQPPALSRRRLDGLPSEPWKNDPALWILSGGSEDPNHAQPSPLDIQNLSRMYLYRRRHAQPAGTAGK